MKTTRFILLTFISLFISNNLFAQAIIADHTNAKLEPITASAINKAKQVLHIAYSSTSHGTQITGGMTGLAEDTDLGNLKGYKGNIYQYNNGGSGGALDLHYKFAGHWNVADLSAGETGSGSKKAWHEATRLYLDQSENADVNVVMWSWCNIIGHDIDEYINRMENLIKEYGPGGTKIASGERTNPVFFVFMTGHNNNGTNNQATFEANKKIRKHCIDHNRVLYDYYDIECYNPDGAYFGDGEANASDNCYGNYTGAHNLAYSCSYSKPSNGNWATAWQNSHTENVDWFNPNSYNCLKTGHTQPLNVNLKAYAAWWLWTTLANKISETTNNPSVAISSSTQLKEDNLQDATINISLSDEAFADNSLSASNFVLNNAPTGTSVQSVTYTNNKAAIVKLSFNETDFDTDITNFNITVKAAELTGTSDLTSNSLTIQAIVESGSPTLNISTTPAMSEDNLNNKEISLVLSNETFKDASLDKANFQLNNAPAGLAVKSVTYIDTKKAVLTLIFDNIDFDANITNFSITAKKEELSGESNLQSNDLTITAINEVPKAIISTTTCLTEDNLNGAVIELELQYEEFSDDNLDVNNFILNNAPTGTSCKAFNYIDKTHAEITLAFDGTDFDNDINNFSIEITQAELTGMTNLTSNLLDIKAIVETTNPSLVISVNSNLNEKYLNNAVIQIKLSNVEFKDGTLDKANFVLNNAPQGLTVQSITYVSKTEADLKLSFDGTDFDNDITNFSVTIKVVEISSRDAITSNDLNIEANIESAIEDIKDKDFIIYPNPVKDEINIDYSGKNSDIIQINIVDRLGRAIMFKQFNQPSTDSRYHLNLQKLSSGNYYIIIKQSNIRISKSFIKE